MGTGFAKQKKQQKELQAKMAMLQQTLSNQMEALVVEGSAGNGLVKIALSGNCEMKSISINPECVDKEDISGLEALIKAAYNDAFKKVQDVAESAPQLQGLFGGF